MHTTHVKYRNKQWMLLNAAQVQNWFNIVFNFGTDCLIIDFGLCTSFSTAKCIQTTNGYVNRKRECTQLVSATRKSEAQGKQQQSTQVKCRKTSVCSRRNDQSGKYWSQNGWRLNLFIAPNIAIENVKPRKTSYCPKRKKNNKEIYLKWT